MEKIFDAHAHAYPPSLAAKAALNPGTLPERPGFLWDNAARFFGIEL